MGYLALNLVLDSLTALLRDRVTHISYNIMALLFWNSVLNLLLVSGALLFRYSVAFLFRYILALLPGHLIALLSWDIITDFFILVVAVLLGYNLTNLLLNILTVFSRYRSADRYEGSSALFNSLVVSILLINILAFLAGYITAFLSGLIPTLLLGNLVAYLLRNILARLSGFIPTLLLRHLLARLSGFVPTLLLWY